MSLVRWDPFGELESVPARLNQLLGRRVPALNGGSDWAPAVDIQESDKEYLIKAEIPEVKKEDVKVSFENGILSLQGERKQEKEEKGKVFHRIERFYGKFVRSFTVPPEVEDQKIAAEFKDGVLTVHLPKVELAKPKPIEVKVA